LEYCDVLFGNHLKEDVILQYVYYLLPPFQINYLITEGIYVNMATYIWIANMCLVHRTNVKNPSVNHIFYQKFILNRFRHNISDKLCCNDIL
jgi:hypothetical protein